MRERTLGKMKRNQSERLAAYERYSDGRIGRDEYLAVRDKLTEESTQMQAHLTELQEGIAALEAKTDPKWTQIYAGPQTMSFNYRLLREKRKELGYTQQEVADAVEANLRTYQKWEGGETKPDGYFLLRILNWLDITDINEVITINKEG